MSNFSLKVPTWNNGCIEETVILKETGEVYKYTFSNSLDAVKIAICSRIGKNNIDLENAVWRQNPNLSISVKNSMNTHNVNYSMTINTKGEERYVYVNMRVGDKWYITSYMGIGGKFVDRFQCDQYRLLINCINIFRETVEDLCKDMNDDYINNLLIPPDDGIADNTAASGSGI
jgi:hypothetical protein